MPPIKRLSDKISATVWLTEADFAAVKSLGFETVVNFRPDGEARGQLRSADAQVAAEAAGLGYFHIPVTKHDLFTDAVVMRAIVAFAGHGPVLAYCASGLRAAIVWAAASARAKPVNEVLAALQEAGFDLGFIRDDLDAQADRARWSNEPVEAGTTDTGLKSRKAVEAAA